VWTGLKGVIREGEAYRHNQRTTSGDKLQAKDSSIVMNDEQFWHGTCVGVIEIHQIGGNRPYKGGWRTEALQWSLGARP